MPELPEVESTVRYLRERIAGLRINAIQVLWHRTFHPSSLGDPQKLLPGLTVETVSRRGKFIVMQLTGEKSFRHYLLCHLRMSGSMDVVDSSFALAPHDRISLSFDNGKDLRFNDTRKFGRFYLVNQLDQVTKDLGVEPLDDSFTAEKLVEIVKSRSSAIKPLLLNQAFISGIGNIYADESLWLARIHPLIRSDRISKAKVIALHAGIQKVLKEAIELQGTDFGDGVVVYGGYKPKVYGNEGKPCPRCGTKIKRLVVGQRGTHICPKCQKL